MLKKKNVCLPATLELREELLDVGVAVPRRGHPRRQSLPVGRLGGHTHMTSMTPY